VKIPTFDPAAAIRAGAQPPAWYHLGVVQALAGDSEGQQSSTQDAATGTSADVYLYNTIGGWFGLTASDFVRDVASLDVDQIVLHLNTPGGDVMEGVTIANVLRAHRAKVVVRVDGLAASAGSVIAMAGDEVVMGVSSELMLHDVWGIAIGNVSDMEAYIRQLESASNSIAAAYAAKAGGTTEQWREVMRKESWYTAQEAVDAGLADRAADADEKATAKGEQVTPGGSLGGYWDMWDTLKSPDRFDLSAFNYAGRAHAPAPTRPASAGGNSQGGKAAMADTQFSEAQLSELRESLGLDADADADAIHAALTDRLSASTDDEGTDEPAPTSAALPEGTVAIDSTQLAALQAAARRGDEARRQQEQESRESLVNAAISDGRIPPARKDHWLDMLAKDPGSADVLAKMAPGLIPVDGPVGYAADGPNGNDPLYDSVFGKGA
jgi:ATP-dependent protease ClpP protease subunit